MITAAISQQSVAAVDAYFESTKQKIFAAIREGVAESTEKLSWTIADKLQGNPIVSRSGALLAAVLSGVKVRETAAIIEGSVNPSNQLKNITSAKFPNGIPYNLPLWLEEGTSVPAVVGKRMVFFSEKLGRIIDPSSHKAFTVAPHPFMNSSLAESEGPILELIKQKVSDAVA